MKTPYERMLERHKNEVARADPKQREALDRQAKNLRTHPEYKDGDLP